MRATAAKRLSPGPSLNSTLQDKQITGKEETFDHLHVDKTFQVVSSYPQSNASNSFGKNEMGNQPSTLENNKKNSPEQMLTQVREPSWQGKIGGEYHDFMKAPNFIRSEIVHGDAPSYNESIVGTKKGTPSYFVTSPNDSPIASPVKNIENVRDIVVTPADTGIELALAGLSVKRKEGPGDSPPPVKRQKNIENLHASPNARSLLLRGNVTRKSPLKKQRGRPRKFSSHKPTVSSKSRSLIDEPDVMDDDLVDVMVQGETEDTSLLTTGVVAAQNQPQAPC